MPAPPPPPATSGVGEELGPAAIIAICVASGAVFVPCIVQYWRRKLLEAEQARLVAAEAWEARVRAKAARELEKAQGGKSGRDSRRSRRGRSSEPGASSGSESGESGRSRSVRSVQSTDLGASSGSESDERSRRKSRKSRKSRRRELGRGESERVARELEEAAAAASRLASGAPPPPPPRRPPAAAPAGRGRQPIPDTDLERGSAASSVSYQSASDTNYDRPTRWWQRQRIRI